MDTIKGPPSNSSEYEMISEPPDTPDVLSYSSSDNNILSPSQISEPNTDNLSLTLSPIENTTSNSSNSSNTSQFKSPLY